MLNIIVIQNVLPVVQSRVQVVLSIDYYSQLTICRKKKNNNKKKSNVPLFLVIISRLCPKDWAMCPLVYTKGKLPFWCPSLILTYNVYSIL